MTSTNAKSLSSCFEITLQTCLPLTQGFDCRNCGRKNCTLFPSLLDAGNHPLTMWLQPRQVAGVWGRSAGYLQELRKLSPFPVGFYFVLFSWLVFLFRDKIHVSIFDGRKKQRSACGPLSLERQWGWKYLPPSVPWSQPTSHEWHSTFAKSIELWGCMTSVLHSLCMTFCNSRRLLQEWW